MVVLRKSALRGPWNCGFEGSETKGPRSAYLSPKLAYHRTLAFLGFGKGLLKNVPLGGFLDGGC
jgi:hypothetical protein